MKEVTKTITAFIADDGKEFSSKEECLKYEQDTNEREICKSFFNKAKDIYVMCKTKPCQRYTDGTYCPFYVYDADAKESCCIFSINPFKWKTVTTYQGEYCDMPLIKED